MAASSNADTKALLLAAAVGGAVATLVVSAWHARKSAQGGEHPSTQPVQLAAAPQQAGEADTDSAAATSDDEAKHAAAVGREAGAGMLVTPRHGRFGMVSDLKLQASLPFELKPTSFRHENAVPGLASAFSSRELRKLVSEHMKSTVVSGLEADGITFQDLADVILYMGYTGESTVYVFGGFLRDAFKGVISDDVDILFRSRSGACVPYLESVAKGRGWPCYRKTDEATGIVRSDFIAIGDKGSRSKFSGHPIGAGCEGDFAMNTLLYDVRTGALIDPTGHGINDSVEFVLRIPFPRVYWEQWHTQDRLVGMKLLRYFNFCGRGYVPASQDMREWIVDKFKELFRDQFDAAAEVTRVFLNRKILKTDVATSVKKEATFRNAMLKEFTEAAVHGTTANASATAEDIAAARRAARVWVLSNLMAVYLTVKKNSLPGGVAALVAVREAEAADLGVSL